MKLNRKFFVRGRSKHERVRTKIHIYFRRKRLECFFLYNGRVELEKYSPAGEDFLMCVEVENFPESVREYANDFDADEHAAMWIEARGKVNGVPDSIRELIKDAEAIQKMLNKLADTLVKDENNKENLEELKQYKENYYYSVEDIAEQLIELSNLDMPEDLKEELKAALYYLKAVAENKYNNDYFRVLYNVLLVITGNETFRSERKILCH